MTLDKKTTLFFLSIAALTFLSPHLDLALSHFFFLEEMRAFVTTPFRDFIFHYGPFPAFAAAAAAAFCLLFGKWLPSLSSTTRPALYLVLLLALGPGLFVHAIFKECWGRPRPKEVIEFGGPHRFRPVYQPLLFSSTPMKSFPSGHSSMGFFFFGFAHLGKWQQRRWLVQLGWISGMLLGTMIGAVRIAQGGHFFTDVLFSGIILWILAKQLSLWILPPKIIPK